VKALTMSESDVEALLNDWNMRIARARDEAYKGLLSALSKLDQSVTRIEVDYNGAGDSGSIEGVKCFSTKGGKEMKVEVGDGEVRNAVEEFAYAQLEEHYGGWEINDGSQGKMTIDVTDGKATFEHEWNVMETQGDNKEVPY
jgi:hypothetical protein